MGGHSKWRFLFALALPCCEALTASAQLPPGDIAQVDVRAEVAAVLYAASATQSAADRVADAKIRGQRSQIERLRVQLSVGAAGAAELRAALTAAEESYVSALAARDRAYAQEIALFRGAVLDIAATPEGAAALARFNAGDETGALAILDNVRTARDAARKKRADIESAAEGRRIAKLAMDARAKGKQLTLQVIARYEEVTRLDPGVHGDWIALGRLYQDAGRLVDAQRAAKAAADTATDEYGRSVAFDALGDVQVAQGDRPAALSSYRASLAIGERLTQADPGNTAWQRALSVSHGRIGDVLLAQGERPAALATYRASLAIVERLAQAHAGDTRWQRALSISHDRIGDVLVAQGERPTALASYRASLTIRERLAQADSGNTTAEEDLRLAQ